MAEQLDIIPILVVADSQNKAEMLNGLLRSQGLAVQPVWTEHAEDWEQHATRPEIVFYFADTPRPDLATVVRSAEKISRPVVVIAGAAAAPGTAAEALSTGAAAWVPTDDAPLLAATVRRERGRHAVLERLQRAEQELAQNRQRLQRLLASSQDALAYLQEGVIVEANPAWADRFGYATPDALAGLPVMDLFSADHQRELKQALKRAAKTPGRGSESYSLTALGKAGNTFQAEVEIASVEVDGGRQQQLVIRGATGTGNNLGLELQEIEEENRQLQQSLRATRQMEPDSRLLWPATFTPVAAERVTRPLAGSTRAIVVIRPAEEDQTVATFGPLGMAEAGARLAQAVSPLLDEQDLATRIDDLTLVALINRADEDTVVKWARQLVAALGEHVFEASARSSHIGFAAGYATVDRIRRLDALIRQAEQAARGAPGAVTRARATAVTGAEADQDTDDTGWAAVIREAFDEHRFAVALRPIEDLSRGAKLYEATPRLLDRDGKEILPDAFLEPAERLELIDPLQRRLVGHAFLALVRMLRAGEQARIVVQLRAAVMTDNKLGDFLRSIVQRTHARLPGKSLILELSLREAGQRIRDTREFAASAEMLNCGLGMRDYVPGDAADKLLEHLSIDTLRLSPKLLPHLQEDDALAERVRAAAAKMAEKGDRLIASGVSDANMMALLYNLGIGTVEGPAIGEPEIFSPASTERPVLDGVDAD